MKKQERQNSSSPILFLGISRAYLDAFDIIWRNELAEKDKFHWNTALLLHPISQLLGVGLETAIKGLLACRAGKVPITHDLEKLFSKLSEDLLLRKLDEALSDLEVPNTYFECNIGKPKSDVEKLYRKSSFQIHLLNLTYNKPYASRYPVLGGHALPDPDASRRIIELVLNQLKAECLSWTPTDGK